MKIKEYIEVMNIELMEHESRIKKDMMIMEVLTGKDCGGMKVSELYKKKKELYVVKEDLGFSKTKVGEYNFEIKTDVTKITAGELYTISHIMEKSGTEIENVHLLIAAISKVYQKKWYRKKILLDLTLEEKAKLLLEADASIAHNLMLFFCRIFMTLLKKSQRDLANEDIAIMNVMSNATATWMQGEAFRSYWGRRLKMLLN